MRRPVVRILVMVAGGLVGGYAGYWIGHAAGWSTNADWPFRIGGGQGAILLSIGLSALGVLVAGLALALPSVYGSRSIRRAGRLIPATVVELWDLGFSAGFSRGLRQVEFEVDVHLDGASSRRSHGVQWVRSSSLDRLTPGSEVMVSYDAARPTRVAIEEGVEVPQPVAG
jgi:hypothetical protein